MSTSEQHADIPTRQDPRADDPDRPTDAQTGTDGQTAADGQTGADRQTTVDPAYAPDQRDDQADANPPYGADPRTGTDPQHTAEPVFGQQPDQADQAYADGGSGPITDATRARPDTGSTPVAATPSATEPERLVAAERAESYSSRWNEVKGMFVDEPRQAVAGADALVGELLEELEQLFREQRRNIEQGLDTDETSTEDLRMALRRYRSFFDRLLSL